MSRVNLRPIFSAVFAATVLLATAARPGIAATGAIIEHFLARALTESDPAAAASPIDIMIERWSTDQEVEKLRGTLVQGGPHMLLPALRQSRPVGAVMYPGIIGAGAGARQRHGRNVLFARTIATPNGRQVIVATDQYLAFGEPSRAWPSDYQFTLLDIRFGPDGRGVGKLAAAGDVGLNTVTKLLEAKNYATRPVRLIDVRSEKF